MDVSQSEDEWVNVSHSDDEVEDDNDGEGEFETDDEQDASSIADLSIYRPEFWSPFGTLNVSSNIVAQTSDWPDWLVQGQSSVADNVSC